MLLSLRLDASLATRNTLSFARTRTHTHTLTHTNKHTLTQIHTHTQTHIHIHKTHTQTFKHTHKKIETHTKVLFAAVFFSLISKKVGELISLYPFLQIVRSFLEIYVEDSTPKRRKNNAQC